MFIFIDPKQYHTPLVTNHISYAKCSLGQTGRVYIVDGKALYSVLAKDP